MATSVRDTTKTKLVERLKQISRGVSTPLGFGRAVESTVEAMLVVAILPRNEAALAESAVLAGADAIAFRVCGAQTEFLKETGDLAAEEAAIREGIVTIGDRAIVGLVIGSNGTVSTADLVRIEKLGVDFVAAYPHLTPASFLELKSVGRLAIVDQQGGAGSRGINDLSIQGALVRIDRPHDSPDEMTVLDVVSYRGVADGVHRPVVVFPSWKLATGDLEILKNAGIEGIAIVGPEPDADASAVGAAIEPFREVIKRLGKPVGRRVALSEPAVILPRMASVGGDGGEEEEGDDDE